MRPIDTMIKMMVISKEYPRKKLENILLNEIGFSLELEIEGLFIEWVLNKKIHESECFFEMGDKTGRWQDEA